MDGDRKRLETMVADAAILRLWDALRPLRSTNVVLQTGAHPDDESSALLTRLARGDGALVAYACATRGEGGQNAIGPERGELLGALRTREMELAAARVPMRLYWLEEDADGPIRDFGFAKTAERTLAVWGRERLVERLVRVIRHLRPDVLLPTFLDVEGQHGHHRAVTRATEQAFHQAADAAAFPDWGLAPWQVKKMYLPAWSGAGRSYDDSAPPPATTVAVEIGGVDAARGCTFAQLAQWSRAAHRCQGMGRWIEPAPDSVPLHRKICLVDAELDETCVFDGLPRSLGDWAGVAGRGPLRVALQESQTAMSRAIDAFPHPVDVLSAVHDAIAAVRRARAALQDGAGDLEPAPAAELDGRLALKESQLARASFAASGLTVGLETAASRVESGGSTAITCRLWNGGVAPLAGVELGIEADQGWQVDVAPAGVPDLAPHSGLGVEGTASVGATVLSRPHGFVFDPGTPAGPLRARVTYGPRHARVSVPIGLREPLAALPGSTVTPRPARRVLPLADRREGFAVELEVRAEGAGGPVEIDWSLPDGWRAIPARSNVDADGGIADLAVRVEPPAAVRPGRHRLAIGVDGRPALAVVGVAYDHVQPTWSSRPAEVDVLVVDLALPTEVRIGYVEGESDRVADWLEQLGLDVTRLDADTLVRGDLERFQTIVVGVQAYRSRADLRVASGRLRAWVEAGGNLVTQYHRPWDHWNPETTPPRPLTIGQPSLRWRVTHPDAPVTVLQPAQPLLHRPNRIGPSDWDGWDKERGLYFASQWDPAYQPLIEVGDPGEAPLQGGLLSARVGRGRHTHVALVLHHQLDQLVPGAFRLLANLVAPSAA